MITKEDTWEALKSPIDLYHNFPVEFPDAGQCYIDKDFAVNRMTMVWHVENNMMYPVMVRWDGSKWIRTCKFFADSPTLTTFSLEEAKEAFDVV